MTNLSRDMQRGREESFGQGAEAYTVTSYPAMREYLHAALSALGEVETRLSPLGHEVEVEMRFRELPVVIDGDSRDLRDGMWINSDAGGAMSGNKFTGNRVLFGWGALPHPSRSDQIVRFTTDISFDSRKFPKELINVSRVKEGIDNLVDCMRVGFVYDFSGGMVSPDIRTERT